MALGLDVKFAQRRGRDLLAEMAAEVEADLARKRVELDALVTGSERPGLVS